MNSFSEKYYFTFPWLKGSGDVLFNMIGILPDEIESLSIVEFVKKLFQEFPQLKKRIIIFFENVANSNEKFTTPTNDIVNLAMYHVLQIIISMLGNRILTNSLCNTYAKHCKNRLTQPESRRKYPDRLIQQFCENMGINCMVGKDFIENIQFPYKMDFPSYLKIAAKLNDPTWKLINHHLINGEVYLIRPDIVMLLREFIREKVKPDFSQMDDELSKSLEKITDIKEILENVEELVKINTNRFNSSFLSDNEKINSELFAPCIKMILFRAAHGENLSHNERLAICFYFLNTNHTIEETVDIFRTSPDFDEAIARYQVEFAAGSGGKGKKYSMFNCAKLKSFHLCAATHPDLGDKLCVNGAKRRNGEISNIQNPAKDYIFWKKVILNRIHRSQIAVMENAFDQEMVKDS